jgi:hypothetical protein
MLVVYFSVNDILLNDEFSDGCCDNGMAIDQFHRLSFWITTKDG